MIKLFRKLWEHRVEMRCRYAPTNGRIMYVKFMSGHIGCMTRMINLDEFTDIWGGDHVLENVLETYLDEFLGEVYRNTPIEDVPVYKDQEVTENA